MLFMSLEIDFIQQNVELTSHMRRPYFLVYLLRIAIFMMRRSISFRNKITNANDRKDPLFRIVSCVKTF